MSRVYDMRPIRKGGPCLMFLSPCCPPLEQFKKKHWLFRTSRKNLCGSQVPDVSWPIFPLVKDILWCFCFHIEICPEFRGRLRLICQIDHSGFLLHVFTLHDAASARDFGLTCISTTLCSLTREWLNSPCYIASWIKPAWSPNSPDPRSSLLLSLLWLGAFPFLAGTPLQPLTM